MRLDEHQQRFVLFAVGGVVAFLAVMILLRPKSSPAQNAASDGGTPAYIPTSNYDISITSGSPATSAPPATVSPPPGSVPPVQPPVSRPPFTHPPVPPVPTRRPPVAVPPRPRPPIFPIHRAPGSALVGRPRETLGTRVNQVAAYARSRLASRPAPAPSARRFVPTPDNGPRPLNGFAGGGVGRGMPSGGNFDIAPFPWGYN